MPTDAKECSVVDWRVLFAAATVQLAPVAVFILLMQRFLIAGLTAGAVG